MTIASNSVKINSRSGPADVLGTSFVCTAAAEGTFADLRTVLLEDEIVQAGDKAVFLLPDGEVVGKSSEAHLKWKTALKGGEVTITRLAHPIDDINNLTSATLNTTESMPTLLRLSDELTRRERLFLVRRSKLGEGINICDDRGPQYTGRAVVADVDPAVIRILEREQTTEEVIVSYSERAATYARAGWAVRALNTSSPWVNNVISTPPNHEGPPAAAPCSSKSAVWVTGRYLHGGYQLALPSIYASSPHTELLAAVKAALAEADLEQRRDRLAKVWDCFGHVYVDCVEMGGKLHATASVETSKQVNKEALETHMRRTLGKKLGRHDSSGTYLFGVDNVLTVGGLFHEHVDKWLASLANVTTWSVIRTVRVVPIIDLFDADIRAQIMAATPTYVTTSTSNLVHQPLDTGVFISPKCSGRQIETSKVTFSTPFPTVPRVLTGIHAFDFYHDSMVRIKGNVPVVTTEQALLEIIIWDKSYQYFSRLSWLAVSSAQGDVQCGTFETLEDHPADSPQQKHTRRVQFERPYEAPPQVAVWFHHFAVDSADHDIRIKVNTSNIARNGFDLHVETWAGSTLWSAGVSWLAHSSSRTDIASGTYKTRDVYPEDDPKRQQAFGRISFTPPLPRAPQSVFTALSALCMSKNNNPRLLPLATRNITETGMDWEVSTWLDTVLYWAEAVFVAF